MMIALTDIGSFLIIARCQGGMGGGVTRSVCNGEVCILGAWGSFEEKGALRL